MDGEWIYLSLFVVVATLINFIIIKMIVGPSTIRGYVLSILVSVILALLILYLFILVGVCYAP